MDLIASTADLAAACSRLSQHPFVTVDTEFMRETTYYPKLCLIQMATPDEGLLVDPLAPGIDLNPFLDLMADERVIKVFHSARQDLEIVWNIGGIVPHPLFDTQVAAMVCGYGDSVSYEQLVNDLAKARVDKSSRFTDWSRRPLSEAQLAYALSDVTHLIQVYEALEAQLQANGRHGWLDEEMAVLTSPDTYRAEPENAWRRLAGRMRKAREIAVLMEVAAWREREAQTRDVPRGRVLKDDAVIDLAVSAPRTVEALGRLRSIPTGFERSRQAQDILAAVERGLARDPKTRAGAGAPGAPPGDRGHRRAAQGAAQGGRRGGGRRAEDHRHRRRPRGHRRSDDAPTSRRCTAGGAQLFGDKALALKHGELGLSVRERAGDGVAGGCPRAGSRPDAPGCYPTTSTRASTSSSRASCFSLAGQPVARQCRELARQLEDDRAVAHDERHARQHAGHRDRDQVGDAHQRRRAGAPARTGAGRRARAARARLVRRQRPRGGRRSRAPR